MEDIHLAGMASSGRTTAITFIEQSTSLLFRRSYSSQFYFFPNFICNFGMIMRMRIRKRTGLLFYETRILKIAEALGSKIMKIIIYIHVCMPSRGHPSAAVFYPAILFYLAPRSGA